MSQVAQGQVKEVAERIGLAVRSLPGVEIAYLVEKLITRFGAPITVEKLSAIQASELKKMVENLRDAPQSDEIRMAVRYLWGEGEGLDQLPQVQPYAPGELPHSVRVAVASNTGENLDGHFGSARRFLIYQVACDQAKLIAIRDPLACEDAEDPNAARAKLIDDCQLLYVHSIGGPAAAKVIRAGIHPVKFPQGGPAAAAIARLQETLKSPPPWLARIMGVHTGLSRFITSEEEA